MKSTVNTKEFPIDVVITWVDGDDPIHRAKRNTYSDESTSFEDIGGDTRFRSIGEIAYCVASINKFAPYVRKIFIVTDNQDPKIESFIKENFPNHIPMEIVNHDTIFHGYEKYIPVFNSLAIAVFPIPLLYKENTSLTTSAATGSGIKCPFWSGSFL